MSVELKGRLFQILPKESGEGRNGRWEKQQFVIETMEQYPKKICIVLWGDKISMLNGVNEGDELNVAVNIESREYNGRWYTDVRAWKLERVAASQDPAPGTLPSDNETLPPSDLMAEGEGSNEEGDLPF
jgi:hypothetical protein